MAEHIGNPAAFTPSIRVLETTDPKHPDTWNPNYAVLIDNDAYLKARADQVDAAKAGYGSLDERLDEMAASAEALGPDMQNMSNAAIMMALDMAGRAHDQIRAFKIARIQEGEILIINRGIVEGCTVTKSTTATRNLNLAAGACFANGRVYPVATGVNVASVPQNTGGGAVTVSVYLVLVGSAWVPATTPIGGAVPDGAIEIYRLTIPANSTDATDPQLTNVTVTDVRRLEPGFPLYVSSPAYAYVPINWLPDTGYQVRFDVVAATGAPCESRAIVVTSRAQNGFGIYLASAADSVTVRWHLTRMNF